MINDTERREVARRLRELGKVVYSPDNTYELMADALDVDDFEGTDELFNRLADLIETEPERTCRDIDYDTESITCSECGEITRDTLFWVDVDGGKTVKGHRPRFCSNCGARVVDE